MFANFKCLGKSPSLNIFRYNIFIGMPPTDTFATPKEFIILGISSTVTKIKKITTENSFPVFLKLVTERQNHTKNEKEICF